MGQRNNHYESAFEEWLRLARLPYVFVDEQKRTLYGTGSLKSLDFIVSAPEGKRLLVDVKGRRFPVAHRATGSKWTNWTTEEDLAHIAQWEQIFGKGFRGLLVFAYDVLEPATYPELRPIFDFRGRHYAFYGIWVDEYFELARRRSLSWETVSLRADDYRRLRFPLHQLCEDSKNCSDPISARSHVS